MLIHIMSYPINYKGSDVEFQTDDIGNVEVTNKKEADGLIRKLNATVGRLDKREYLYEEISTKSVDDLLQHLLKPITVNMILVSHKEDYSRIYIYIERLFSPGTKNGEFFDEDPSDYKGHIKRFKFCIDAEVFERMTAKKELIQFGLDLIGERMPEGFEYREIPKI